MPLADSLKTFDDQAKAGKIRAIGLSAISSPTGWPRPASSPASTASRRSARFQPWYNMLEREKYEGALRDVAVKEGLAVFPYYSLANGFLTGKYRSKADLDKSPRGLRNIAYLEGKGPECPGCVGRGRSRDRRRLGQRRFGLDDGAADHHRPDRQRHEPGAGEGADRGDDAGADARAARKAQRGQLIRRRVTWPAPSGRGRRPSRPDCPCS